MIKTGSSDVYHSVYINSRCSYLRSYKMGDNSCSINSVSITTSITITTSFWGFVFFASTDALRERYSNYISSFKRFCKLNYFFLTCQINHSGGIFNSIGEEGESAISEWGNSGKPWCVAKAGLRRQRLLVSNSQTGHLKWGAAERGEWRVKATTDIHTHRKPNPTSELCYFWKQKWYV